MRIALLTDWFHPRVGGIEVHLLELATRLARRGHAVTVVTPWPGGDAVEGVPVERLRLRTVPGVGVSLNPVALVREMDRVLSAGAFDVVHGHVSFGSTAVFAAGHVATRLGIPMVGTFHSVFRSLGWVYVAAAPILRWRRWPFRATAVSEAVARDLRWIMPERPVEVLPNAIDPEAWPRTAPEPTAGRLRLVTTARLQRRKRVEALVRAVDRVRRQVGPATEVTLDVLGDGPEREALETRIRTLGLEGSVRLLGPGDADAVRALLARGDVFVNAADQESFGIAALEALCTGLPVVARREGGVGTFIRDGVNGRLVGSDDEMVRVLAELATEAGTLERLRQGAAEPIPARYTWDALIDRHEALYETLVRGTPAEE